MIFALTEKFCIFQPPYFLKSMFPPQLCSLHYSFFFFFFLLRSRNHPFSTNFRVDKLSSLTNFLEEKTCKSVNHWRVEIAFDSRRAAYRSNTEICIDFSTIKYYKLLFIVLLQQQLFHEKKEKTAKYNQGVEKEKSGRMGKFTSEELIFHCCGLVLLWSSLSQKFGLLPYFKNKLWNFGNDLLEQHTYFLF